MNYIEYITFFLLISTSILIFWNYCRKIRYDHFCRITIKALLKKQKDQTGERFFSTDVIQKTVKTLIKQGNKKALAFLFFGRTGLAYKALQKSPQLAALLEAFTNPQQALSKLETTNDEVFFAELAALYFVCARHQKARELLSRIQSKDRYTNAKKFYYQAQYQMQEGDMLSASENAYNAAKLFRRCGAFVEEAGAYLLLGTVYRVSASADMSQFMLDTSLKIYKNLNSLSNQADVLGNLGMLMVLQERFDEALDYFNKSLEINSQINRRTARADILNQLALLYLIDKKFEKAAEFGLDALSIHQNMQNDVGEAFSRDLLSYIKYIGKDYSGALKEAKTAEALHRKSANSSAYLENLYIQAQIMFEEEKLDEAEIILRKITASKLETSFHTAGAYNLLGLIFLKKGDIQRAKGLFQQSLILEQKNERLSGAAIDYVNISLVETGLGNREQARKNLELALEYACAFGENELSCAIRDRLN